MGGLASPTGEKALIRPSGLSGKGGGGGMDLSLNRLEAVVVAAPREGGVVALE